MRRLHAYVTMLRSCLTDAFHLTQAGPQRDPLGSWNLRNTFSALAVTLAGTLAGVSAHLDERFRQRLDPVVSSPSYGIEIEGIGGRLARDGHVELEDDR
jgi:hypothetical protein